MEIPACYYRVSMKAIVYDKTRSKILLSQENDAWELPGGGLEWGEEPRMGLSREIEEETSIKTTSVAEIPSHFFTYQTSSGIWKAHVLYEASLENMNFTPSKECTALQFFNLDEIADLKIDKSMHFVLQYLSAKLRK